MKKGAVGIPRVTTTLRPDCPSCSSQRRQGLLGTIRIAQAPPPRLRIPEPALAGPDLKIPYRPRSVNLQAVATAAIALGTALFAASPKCPGYAPTSPGWSPRRRTFTDTGSDEVFEKFPMSQAGGLQQNAAFRPPAPRPHASSLSVPPWQAQERLSPPGQVD